MRRLKIENSQKKELDTRLAAYDHWAQRRRHGSRA